jgi:hypothetical protein
MMTTLADAELPRKKGSTCMAARTFTTGVGATRAPDALARRLRSWGLLFIAGDLALVGARVATYRAFFSMPGATAYLAEPVIALAIYAAALAVLPFPVARLPNASTALRVGTGVGLVGAGVDMVGLALESLWALPQRIVAVATGSAMLALFLSFAAAGFLAARRTRSFWLGLGAAVWSALVVCVLVVAFGLLIANLDLPQLARNETGDLDYLRSGWTDVRAFAIANTFDAGFTHLVEAPVIAAVLGAVGSGAARFTQHGAQRRRDNLTAR